MYAGTTVTDLAAIASSRLESLADTVKRLLKEVKAMKPDSDQFLSVAPPNYCKTMALVRLIAFLDGIDAPLVARANEITSA